jgi:hypothetical protein
VIRLWRRIRGFYLTDKTKQAIAERECVHDGDFDRPMCSECSAFYNGM